MCYLLFLGPIVSSGTISSTQDDLQRTCSIDEIHGRISRAFQLSNKIEAERALRNQLYIKYVYEKWCDVWECCRLFTVNSKQSQRSDFISMRCKCCE